MKYMLQGMVFLAFVSCKKEDQTIFEFDLSNSYRIESSGESFETPNAYESQSTNRFHLVLSDAEIGNALTQPYYGGPWDYLSPPLQLKYRYHLQKVKVN